MFLSNSEAICLCNVWLVTVTDYLPLTDLQCVTHSPQCFSGRLKVVAADVRFNGRSPLNDKVASLIEGLIIEVVWCAAHEVPVHKAILHVDLIQCRAELGP